MWLKDELIFPNTPITQNTGLEPLVTEKCSLNKDSRNQIKESKHLGYYLITTLQGFFHIAFIWLLYCFFILLYLSFVTLLTSRISQISIKWEEAQCYFDLITTYRLHSPPIPGVLAESSSKPWLQANRGGGWGGHFLQVWVQGPLRLQHFWEALSQRSSHQNLPLVGLFSICFYFSSLSLQPKHYPSV